MNTCKSQIQVPGRSKIWNSKKGEFYSRKAPGITFGLKKYYLELNNYCVQYPAVSDVGYSSYTFPTIACAVMSRLFMFYIYIYIYIYVVYLTLPSVD